MEAKSAIRFSDVPPALLDMFEKYSCRVTLKPLKSSLQICVQRLPHPAEESPEGLFEIYTDVGYCELTDKVCFTAYGKNLPDTKLTPKVWQTELAALTAENEAEYAKLKAQREEIAELQKVRRYVDIALKADAPQKAKTKHHDIDR